MLRAYNDTKQLRAKSTIETTPPGHGECPTTSAKIKAITPMTTNTLTRPGASIP
jgi:hypothetical protein